MANGISIKLGGVEHWMVYNAEAHYRINEQYGDDFIKAFAGNGREGWEITLGVAAIMLEQGELCRRFLGYDAAILISAEELRAVISLSDIPTFKERVYRAIMAGLRREVKDPADKSVDEGLAELEKKTEMC